MKTSRSMTYKKITRAAYLLGVIFLLAGMMLSMVSQPAQASSLAKPTSPVVRTPEGPQPTQVTPPPSHNPDNPGIPGRRVPGRNIQNFNFSGQADAPDVPTPPVRYSILASGSIRFTQSDYCLSQPGSGWVTATLVVSLPVGETALLARNWYVVHPNPYPEHPEYNSGQQLENIVVSNGDRISWDAFWPGASLWNLNEQEYSTIEIHWGALLMELDGTPIGDAGSLDAFFNGKCNNRPSLSVSHQCVVGGGIQWTAHNPGSTVTPASFDITDGPSGYVSVPPYDSVVLGTSTGGVHTATLTYDNGQGVLTTATDSSVAGECMPIPALTVSHACSANGVVFTAHNPNSATITIDYTDGTTSGTADVPGNGSVDFLTLPAGTAHDVTIEWPDSTGGKGSAQDHSAADECGSTAVLTLSHQCKVGGGIIWNVHNGGTASVNYSWNLDNNALTGSGTVGAGETVTVTETSGGAHYLEITWPDGTTFDSSTVDECGGTPHPVLTLSRQCVTGGGIQWSVTNNGNLAADFTWTLDTNADQGSGSVGIGETVVVTTTTGGAHLLTLTWDGNSVSMQSAEQECGGANVLTISYACAVPSGIQWTVSNGGLTDLSFDWNLDNNTQVGTGLAPAGGSTNVVVSTGGSHSLSITWSGGSASSSSTMSDCNPQPITLGLRWQCSADNSGVDWVVANNNSVDVSFNWSLDGGPATADTVPANSSKIFHTVPGHDSHEMAITWSDTIGTYSIKDTNPGNVCVLPPEPVLTVSVRCVMQNTVEWRVVNPGENAVDFEWNLDDNAQTGSDTAPAKGSKVFLVSSGGQHSVTITWPQENSYTRTTSDGFCGIIIQTPTPTDGTPGTPVTTGTPGVTTGGTPVKSNIPQTGGTPVPTLAAPGSPSSASNGQGVAVSPVTGIDLNALTSAQLIQRLLTNLGLLFLGVALVLTGFGSRIK